MLCTHSAASVSKKTKQIDSSACAAGEFKVVKELDDALVKKEGKLSHVDLIPMLGLADTLKVCERGL